jgi:hypothetical protein
MISGLGVGLLLEQVTSKPVSAKNCFAFTEKTDETTS